ncbi:right-handed parallel beta-helix repeat-containing protein [Salipiger sp. H15]|uniref:Right-handed parallel beta-helix repeat-containing protein n=1 Tax=Alloyangia sp. H15 TaxID=3029062 RepID=A0AAU8ACA0_9RHOB
MALIKCLGRVASRAMPVLFGTILFTALPPDRPALAQQPPAAAAPVGFGAQTRGGGDGRVIIVTTLADDGPGSLRWAVEGQSGPRTIHFEVGGSIALSHQIEIGPDVTIDGTTAPETLTITGGRLRVIGSNVILRGLRLRPGDGPGDDPENRDGISIGEGRKPIRNVVIDGNSISWSVDEAMSVWGNVADVTISNNIIAEALDESIHSKGRHSMGLLIGGGAAKRITVIGNLLAHNRHRNPNIKDASQQIEFLNNLVYNWGASGFQGTGSTVNIIGNVYIPGPNSVDRPPLHLQDGDTPGPNFFVEDTIGAIRSDAVVTLSDRPVFEGSGAPVLPSAAVEEAVLENAGARFPARDSVDQRLIAEVRGRGGYIIDSPEQVIRGRVPPKPRAPDGGDGQNSRPARACSGQDCGEGVVLQPGVANGG